jgi:hypothetical protein
LSNFTVNALRDVPHYGVVVIEQQTERFLARHFITQRIVVSNHGVGASEVERIPI